MTASTDIFHRAGVDVATDEKARRAVKNFRSLQPTLTAYARNLTKRQDISVEMAARDNGSTDGKKIYYRPPIALGEQIAHERRVCDKRAGETLELICPACRLREDILVVIYHEIGHIAFESFAQVSDEDAELTMKKAIEEVGTKYAKKIREALDRAPARVKNSYIGVSHFVSPFLPFLVNCLEDARVNAEMFRARPGTKVMFDSNTARIFREGVEQVDKNTGELKVIKWCDYPKNAQATLGVFCIASGYTFSGWFAADVEESLKDTKLIELVRSIDTVRSAAGVYHLAFPVLARLRELGYCKSDKDPEDEEEQSEDSQEAPEPGLSGGAPEEAGNSGDSDPSDAEPEAGDSGSDRQEPGSEGEPGEGGDSDGGSETDPGAEDSGAGGTEEAQERSEPESTDDGDEGDAGPAAGDGASSDPTGSEVAGDEDGDVGEPEADEEAGGADSSEELGQDSSASEDTSEGPDMAADDPDEGGEPAVGEAGTGTAGDNQELEEGSGGRQAAQSSGEDQREEDDGADDSSADGDLGGSGEQVDDTTQGGDASLDGNRDEADQPADAGSTDLDEAEAIDTGADAGEGGIDLLENEANDDVPLGDPSDVEFALIKLGDHEDKPTSMEEQASEEAVDRAIIQGLFFETPSRRIYGVREHHYGQPVVVDGYNVSQAWDLSGSSYAAMGRGHLLGREGDFHAPESVLGPALVRMRVAFSENQRGKNERNLKGGKINTKVLGKRAWNNDERLFRKRTMPGKRDYFVVIGMDVSGSTVGRNIVLEKRAVMAQAELCKRMGVQFAIYAHSGNLHSPLSGRSNGFDLDVYLVKEPNEPWSDEVQKRLMDLGPDSANLDGHFLEYLMRKADAHRATDKIILYYSDGKMPAENHDEELEILQREIRKAAMKKITLLGVGIRTDSPARHGLDTVQVDTDEDIVKVVRHLEKKMN